jgi:hypothetical protein
MIEKGGSQGGQSNSRGKIRTASCSPRSIRRELCAPDGAFMTEKRSNPVAGPLSQHGVAIFTT